jgi:hypothetical protein
MPGPNSSPDGDTRLVVGHPAQEFVWVEVKSTKDERFPGYWEPLRINLARKGRLITGKTR